VWLWIIRLLIVLLFVIMVVWRGSAKWGIALLTATTVVLLDALRVRGALDDSGYLGWFLGGLVAAGAFTWLAALLRPLVRRHGPGIAPRPTAGPATPFQADESGIDRGLLLKQMQQHLGPEDLLDLIFDAGLNEGDYFQPNQSARERFVAVIDGAAAEGNLVALALGVERIVTPLSADSLPRLEKLSADTPPALLRQYLLAHCDLARLNQLATRLGADPEALGSDAKSSRIRRLLLWLMRRGRLGDLAAALQQQQNP
jgi:hypothetical protein